MNDKFTNKMNSEDETIAQKLDRVANQTNINAQFASELEERLRIAHSPKAGWFASSFQQVSPALRWVGLVILLVLVLSWSIRSLIPAPQPAINNTPVNPDIAAPTPDASPDETATPIAEDGGYDWRGTKLYLAAPVPQSPAEAKLFTLRDEQLATVDSVRALASQHAIQGTVFETPGRLPGTTSYLVTDGKQRLYVQSGLNYDYYSDYGAYTYMSGNRNITDEVASAAIDAFMKAHGLDYQYQLENAHLTPGMYYVLPLTPDGLTIRHNYNMPARIEFTVDENKEVIRVTSYQVGYDVVEGTYSLRTAEEAFQQVLDQSNMIQSGVLEIVRSAGISNAGFWSRTYPDDELITIYGLPTSYPATESGGAPFISIGQFAATGNIGGIENVDSSTYIEATGQFQTENGIRTFKVESWKVSNLAETYISGTLRREGDQIILTADDASGEYVIVDAPPDVPLNTKIPPDDYLAVGGLIVDGNFEWNSIQHYPAGSGGGGGAGGGTGFYKLNLSGTPVPFPTPQPESSQGNVEYIIKEGDTLLALAEAYGITPEKIVQANEWLSEAHALIPGKRLIIPGVRVNVGSSEYTVQENDTLASIALNSGVTVDELMQANGIVDNLVFTGQTLIIPGTQLQAQNPLIGKRFEDQRGIFITNIYRKPDGSERAEYSFITIKDREYYNFVLEGDGLQELEKYHNRPVNIWGTIQHVDQYNRISFKVEKYEIPYPDLQIQLFQGTQENVSINRQNITMFTTTDGQKYVLLNPIGDRDQTTVDPKKPLLILEAMAIPGESFEGYPTLRYFNGGLAMDPMTGEPAEFSVTADQPYVMDEAPIVENYVPPALTIEKVELVYYVPDPLYGTPDPNAGAVPPQYIQPAWRFYGHYTNGDEVEFLVQALKEQYLLPELAPYTPPG